MWICNVGFASCNDNFTDHTVSPSVDMTDKYSDKRFVVLHYTAPSYSGGVEMVIRDFLVLMSKLGHRGKLIVGKGAIANLNLKGIDFTKNHYLDANNEEIINANNSLLKGEINSAIINLCNTIIAYLSEQLCPGDIIMAHNIITNSFNLPLVMALHKLFQTNRGLSMLAWCHDLAWGKGATNPHDYSIYPLNLLTTPWPRTHYLTLSSERKAEIQEMIAITDEQISVISPYIDAGRVLSLSETVITIITANRILESDVCIIYPCRMSRRKNIELALQLVHHIKTMGSSVRLLITGPISPHKTQDSEEYREEIRGLIAKLGLMNEVILINHKYADSENNSILLNEDVSGLYRIADLVLSTSRDEGFGLSIVEAALVGTPILVNNQTAIALRNHECVNVFNSAERVSEIATKILALVKRGQFRRKLLLRYVSNYHWEKLSQISQNKLTS